MDIRYAWEKLFRAVESLASGTGSIQDRLYNTCVSHLGGLRPDIFPQEIRDEFEDLWEIVTKIQPLHSDQGSLKTTIEALSEDRARKLAERLVSMFSRVAQQYGAEIAGKTQ
jgi:hypothetical protein